MTDSLQITEGQAIESIEICEISKEQLMQYANASGDPNPIHLDVAAAKAAGLPGIIAHGMLIAAIVAERAERFRRASLPNWKLKSLQTRFRAMTFPGEKILVGGKVRQVSANEVSVLLKACNPEGEVKVSGTIHFDF